MKKIWVMLVMGVAMILVGVHGQLVVAESVESAESADAANANTLGNGNACGGDSVLKALNLRPWYSGLLGSDCELKQVSGLNGGGSGNTVTLSQMIWTIVLNVMSLVLGIAGYLAVGFVIYGGYTYMTARNNPSKVASGKTIIVNALIGLSVCVLASIISGAIADIINNAASQGADFFISLANTAFLWAGIVAVIIIIMAGIQYITSTGDPGKVSQAKTIIMNAIIGLLIVVLAAAIVNLVLGAIV